MKPSHFKDNARAPIIAMDFDETISIGNSYPNCGTPRKYAKEVMNFLVDIGCHVVIWTSRDIAINQETRQVYDDLSVMIDWLNEHNIKYSAINKSIQFAPFHYNGRKIYAHLYVDDRSLGWDHDDEFIMFRVLSSILNMVGIKDNEIINTTIFEIISRREIVHFETIRDAIKQWN